MGFIKLLFLLAAGGLICSTGYLILVAIAVIRFRQSSPSPILSDANLPPITLFKPLCGMEPNLEENLESFFTQDYPCFEIIFGTRHRSDPALSVVRKVMRRHPEVPVRFTISGEPDRPNAKVCSLEKMYLQARHDYLVISDSDVCVAKNYLREIIHPLLREEVGLVTCLYRGVPTGGFWSRLEALGMSVEMTAGVIVADLLEGMKFALGPTMALRRDVLDSIGGFALLANYCADDYVLGRAVHNAGKQVVLSRHVIEHVVINRSLKSSVEHQVRWMKSTRFSREWGHVATSLTFSMIFGLASFLSGVAMGHRRLGWDLFLLALLNRMVLSVVAGWGGVGDFRSLRDCWLYPVRDFMGFLFWCASFSGREIVWRGEHYELEPGGFMIPSTVTDVNGKTVSGTVAVDHLS